VDARTNPDPADGPNQHTTSSKQVNYTYDIDQVTDFEIGTITTPDCALFYEVYENNTQPEQLSSTTFAAPGSAELIYAVGHLHTGSINISLYVNDKHVCSSYPRYGKTPGKAGDEYGYVVEMSTCLSKETSALTPPLSASASAGCGLRRMYVDRRMDVC
jgi:hypothetical protein